MIPSLSQVRRFVFWEPCISPHTHHLLVALADHLPGVQVISCADTDLPPERRALGWEVPRSAQIATIVAPDRAQIQRLVEEAPEASIHVLNGLRHIPTIVTATEFLRRVKTQVVMQHEPRVFEGLGGYLRLFQSWLTESWHRQHLRAVLAVGRNGTPWFRRAGYAVDRIFPFAYFIPPPAADQPRATAEDRLTVGYVGRLIRMKGVPDLIDALPHLGPQARLLLAGRGAEEAALTAQAQAAGITADFRGVIPNHAIGPFLASLDVLVLPSRSMDDGWGVVVSEALMQGVPVVATPQVGASIMLDDPRNGRCVPANSPIAIAHAIQDLVRSGATTAEARADRRMRTCRQLTAEAGATHLIAILRHLLDKTPRPAPFYLAGT